MSKLAESLEEMQRDILQGDLKDNPYLQSSSVPLLDKELKTKVKKIIPAINELLRMLNTFSDSLDVFMNSIQEEVDGLKKDMQEMKKSDEELSRKYDECIRRAAEIELDVKVIRNEYMSRMVREEGDFMELSNRVKLKKGESAVIGSVENLYNPKKQIRIYAYDEGSKCYKFIDYDFKVESWGSSAYTFNVSPVELQIHGDGSEVTLVNRSSWEVVVFVYV